MSKDRSLIPELRRMPLEAYKEAFKAVLIVLLFSSVPIVASAFAGYARIIQGPEGSFFHLIWYNILNGEPLIYAASYLAPVFYSMHLYNKRKAEFPYFSAILYISFALIVVTLLVFVGVRAKSEMVPAFVHTMTAITYFLSIGLWYIATVFEKALTIPIPDFKDEENELAKKLSTFGGEV